MNRKFVVYNTKLEGPLDTTRSFRRLADAIKYAKEAVVHWGKFGKYVVVEEVIKKPVSFQ